MILYSGHITVGLTIRSVWTHVFVLLTVGTIVLIDWPTVYPAVSPVVW